jgi:hypothetical protein
MHMRLLFFPLENRLGNSNVSAIIPTQKGTHRQAVADGRRWASRSESPYTWYAYD